MEISSREHICVSHRTQVAELRLKEDRKAFQLGKNLGKQNFFLDGNAEGPGACSGW